jgi:hypothetical protein
MQTTTLQEMAREQTIAATTRQAPVEAKSFFSTSRSLTIHPSAGEQVVQGGKLVGTFGEVIEQFTPVGEYGMLVTRNPITIAWIEDQIAAGRDDFLTAEEYNRRITPPAVRLATEQEKTRQLMERNEALEALLAQHKRVTEATKTEGKPPQGK